MNMRVNMYPKFLIFLTGINYKAIWIDKSDHSTADILQ